MCPHTTIYVSWCCYICVLILLYMCPHTTHLLSCIESSHASHELTKIYQGSIKALFKLYSGSIKVTSRFSSLLSRTESSHASPELTRGHVSFFFVLIPASGRLGGVSKAAAATTAATAAWSCGGQWGSWMRRRGRKSGWTQVLTLAYA